MCCINKIFYGKTADYLYTADYSLLSKDLTLARTLGT